MQTSPHSPGYPSPSNTPQERSLPHDSRRPVASLCRLPGEPLLGEKA